MLLLLGVMRPPLVGGLGSLQRSLSHMRPVIRLVDCPRSPLAHHPLHCTSKLAVGAVDGFLAPQL